MEETSELLIAVHKVVFWPEGDSGNAIFKVKQDGKEFTAIGPKPDLKPKRGALLKVWGDWDYHEQYGDQFRFHLCYPELSVKEIVYGYLNLSSEHSRMLYTAYEGDTFRFLRDAPKAVIEQQVVPQDIVWVAHWSTLRFEKMRASVGHLVQLLGKRGFQLGKLIPAAFGKWGSKTEAVIRKNPYALLSLPSAGWSRCDQLYLDLGHPPARLKRQTLLVLHLLDSDSSGDCWLEAGPLAQKLQETIGEHARPIEAMKLGLRADLLAKRVDSKGKKWLALAEVAKQEIAVATIAVRLSEWICKQPKSDDPLWKHLQTVTSKASVLSVPSWQTITTTTSGSLSEHSTLDDMP